MSVYNLAEFRDDYFECKKFDYMQYELPTMIHDYFDLHMNEHREVALPISFLLKALNKYLLALDERFQPTTPEKYREVEKNILTAMKDAIALLGSQSTEDDKLLIGAIQYAKRALAKNTDSYQLNYPYEAAEFFKDSKLLLSLENSHE